MGNNDAIDKSLTSYLRRNKNAKQPRKSFTAFSVKEIYNNPKTGKQVVYDTDGNYFRIEDTTLTGKRVYTYLFSNLRFESIYEKILSLFIWQSTVKKSLQLLTTRSM